MAAKSGDRAKSGTTRLLPYLFRYPRSLLLGTICVGLTAASHLLLPWILQRAVDELVALSADGARMYASFFVAAALAGGFFRSSARRLMLGLTQHVESDLRGQYFKRLTLLPQSYFDNQRCGDLMSRATHDIRAVGAMLAPTIMYLGFTVPVFLVAVLLMFRIDAALTARILIPIGILAVLARILDKAMRERLAAVQNQLSAVNVVVHEGLSGARIIRAYGQEANEVDRFRSSNRQYLERSTRSIRLQTLLEPTISALLGVGTLLVLWIGGRGVVQGQITLGQLVAFNAYLVMLCWPVLAFGSMATAIQLGIVSWKRVRDVLDQEVETPSPERNVAGFAGRIEGAIEVSHLTFSYPGAQKPALNDVSFRIPCGEIVVLVGAIGSGKSTLLQLLLRVYDPPPQSVFVDGRDVREIPLHELRRAIAIATQEPFCFSGTIGENVAFGVESGASPDRRDDHSAIPGGSCDETAVLQACVTACLEEDLACFTEGLETLVGERGVRLSGGQKQRLALARALAANPRVILLDDPCSNLDAETEGRLWQRLLTSLAGRTVLLASHRLSTMRAADRVLVLSDGRIVEDGTHDELISRAGPYAWLYQKQVLEHDLTAS